GIYRNVWLKTRGQSYLESDGVYISTKKVDADWQIDVETDLQIDETVTLSHELFDQSQRVAESQAVVGQSQKNQQWLTVKRPKLWSPKNPNLYELKTTLLNQAGQVIEEVSHRVGFRSVNLDPDKGLFI